MVIKKPHITEKAMDLMDFENKLQFIVEDKATKKEIKQEVEDQWGEEVELVNTMITPSGEKKATVKFKEEGISDDIASRMGMF